MNSFTPSYDNKIAKKYSTKTLDHKVHNKLALQKELGWVEEKKVPVVCIPVGASSTNGGELLKDVLPGLLELNIQILVLGKGEQEFGKLFTELTEEHSHRIAIIKEEETQQRKMYAAADIALFFSNPSKTPELQHSLRYGAVPVSLKAPGLKDYNPVQESGTSFLYEKEDKWHCFGALVRAIETYRFPYDWRTIQRHCMEVEL